MSQKPIVIVVDDDESVRDTVMAVLQVLGLEVITTDSGETALQFLSDTTSLLITDFYMSGGMDGNNLARQAKQRYPNLPIIIMSGAHLQIAKDATRDLAITAYLPKPFSVQTLKEMLQGAKVLPVSTTN